MSAAIVATMPAFRRDLTMLLLILTLAHAVAWAVTTGGQLARSVGYLFVDGTPVGGDFINMWTVGRLAIAGNFTAIYDPTAFMAYQDSFLHSYIGLRLWAYPPHSIFLSWPFGTVDYFAALALWSAVGLGVLFYGARRIGFDRTETAIILLSPAALSCLYFGQTGNFATGLMLLALSARRGSDPVPIIAAALLTIKPQAGFLLPVLWVIQRRWGAIAATAGLALLLGALSVLGFGLTSWRGYVFDTLPLLDELERHGTGPFMMMIPSAFMALRILTGNGDLAALLHLVFALGVGGYMIWRLIVVKDTFARNALVLIVAVLVTPYMHNYDLALLLSGALLVGRLYAGVTWVFVLIAIAWAMPQLVMVLNFSGVPLSPLLILPLLVLAGHPGALKRL